MTATKKIKPTKEIAALRNLTAEKFIDKLSSLRSKTATDNSRYFKDDDKTNKNLGVRMSPIFSLAKQFTYMPISEIDPTTNSGC